MLPTGLAFSTASAQESSDTPPPSAANPPLGAHASADTQATTYLFLNDAEVSFIESAVARLIPADDRWPGALEAGPTISTSNWAAPGVRASASTVAVPGSRARLARDLSGLELGSRNLGGVPSDVFFTHLWECTLEGFSDGRRPDDLL